MISRPALKKDHQVFLEFLNDTFGTESVIRRMGPEKQGWRSVYCFFYRDTPEEGMSTTVTYGLSEAHHPDWISGRPELIITVRSTSEEWGLAAGFFAASFRGERTFEYGSLFTLDEPISTESGMSALFAFAPAILDSGRWRVELSTKTLNLIGMYPLYPGEVDLYRRIGLERFWKLEGYDIYSVTRPDLSINSRGAPG
jgi:hypothetical protein